MKQQECIHECTDCFGVGIIGCEDHEGALFDENCAECQDGNHKCEACDDGDVVWCPFNELPDASDTDCEKCDRLDIPLALVEMDGHEIHICESCYIDAHNSWHDRSPQLRWDKP
jgi:hypothetical protein